MGFYCDSGKEGKVRPNATHERRGTALKSTKRVKKIDAD